jgi:nitrous oxide reductase accessory protein NosL
MRIKTTFTALILCFAAAVSGCKKEAATGPVEIKFDRDACGRCGMVISDKGYAVEVRGGPDHKIHKFDDFGCAMHWLEGQPWAKDATTEIWVADVKSGEWMDGRKSRFVSGKSTPMNYGYAATKESGAETVGMDEAKEKVMSRK